MSQLSWSPAEEAVPAAPPTRGEPRVAHRTQEELDERNRSYGHAGVSQAQEILRGRYRLATAQEAFVLLRNASQRHNIKLRTLADAVIRTPGPDRDAARWFPARARYSPPRLSGLSVDNGSRASQGAVLKAVLHQVLSVTQTPMGNVQLARGGQLHLVRHTGLNRYFTDFFAFVDAPTTACSRAAAERRQVTVPDVAVADVFDEASRQAILQAGSRAVHSLPLLDRSGRVLGMVSSHHERPVGGFSRARLTTLRQTGSDAGRWLDWHRRTVVLDALEHLHSTATATAA
ncbi:GAF and ANTAR domain-containing protein [Streptomyces sp. NPDC005574]|uniref:GAF and ANTAR domain-containing protein n=1 Tax=Streptomyces sp. NPDC005574 TaxID=3156891 RepID=UPI0033A07AD1